MTHTQRPLPPNMVFTQGPSAHLGTLATGHRLGTISGSSGIVRFVSGGVVKTFRCATLEVTRYPFFFITRKNGIQFEDWKSAVDTCSRARINPDDESWADVFHPDGQWCKTFSWRGDSASYSHPIQYPAEDVAQELAQTLSASIHSQPLT